MLEYISSEAILDCMHIGHTFRGRFKAMSKAARPMRVDAYSVIRRVARASLPLGPSDLSSCLMY